MYDSNVSITSVHPGGIKTNIISNSKIVTKEGIFKDKEKAARTMEKTFITTPEKAAGLIVEGILKNKRRVLIGRDARFLDLVQRFFPQSYQKLIVLNSRKAFISKKTA
jgi:short-subunit dehydrogenase